jgi:Domain of unknown function (DUF4388)/FHA domain
MSEGVLSGSLSAFRLPEVLTFLSTTRKGGTLTLANDSREAYLFFDDGALIYAGSNQEQFRLGNILLRKKRISREQRDRIDEVMQNGGGQFGTIAVQQHVITDPQLREFLKVQVSEIVYDCFVWTGGRFTFKEETSLPSHAVTIAVDLPNLIMEGARRIEEWEQCVQLLPDNAVVYRVVSTPKDEKITLTADEWKILFLINGIRTLEELCHDAEDDPFQVYRVIYGLLSNRLIEVAPPPLEDDDTENPKTKPLPVQGDATMRQGTPQFGSETTMHEEASDDTSLLVSSEANLSYSDVVRPTVSQLAVAGQETVIALTEPEYLLGRHRDNNIQIHDLGVSGFHARIYRGPDGYVIEDLKSRNGTWVNNARVFVCTLKHGDVVHVGQTDLLYEVLI